MTDSSRRPNLETILFILAVFLAFALRLLHLGELPLSDEEARWAMQAFDFTKGLHPVIGPQPAYVLLTALVFYIFHASNFAARLIPALAGAALVFAPRFFRDRLGSKVALVLAFALALEPGLLAVSRQAGSPIMVLSAVVFAWGFWRAGNLRGAGIMAGLALLSGPLLWPGLVGLAITYFLSRSLLPAPDQEASDTEKQPLFDRQKLTTAGAYALGTYLVIGSLFLLATGGLSAGLASLPAYLSGWVPTDAGGVPGLYLLLALVVYDFFAVVLAAINLVRGIRQQDWLTISLGLWMAVALAIALVYPSRQVADLVWVLIPLWSLAALEFARYLNPIKDGVWETLGMMALTIAILIFALFNFLTIAVSPLNMNDVMRNIGSIALTNGQIYWSVVLGSLLLLGASVALVGYGWSKDVAFQGATWGLLIAFVFYTMSASMAAANLRTRTTQELWAPGPQTVQAVALSNQMDDFSDWDVGVIQSLDVFVSGIDSPALRWVLRDWDATYSSAPTLTGTPSFVVASSQLSAPELTSAYRGQEFVWRGYPSWDTIQPSDWLRWAISHNVPSVQEKVVLWTRSDIFIDARSSKP
ncbi:MAG: hypothetical protein WA821_00065 [Anaerolineales bacterium]